MAKLLRNLGRGLTNKTRSQKEMNQSRFSAFAQERATTEKVRDRLKSSTTIIY